MKLKSRKGTRPALCIIAVIFRVESQFFPDATDGGGGGGEETWEKHTLYGRQVKLFEKVSVSVRSF